MWFCWVLGSAKVCIETVLAYRTKRGFREQPVVPEWQDGDQPNWNWGGIPWKTHGLLSGKHTKNDGKSPFIAG